MEKVFTLLLTDLIDSTAINARLGDAAMAELWDRHDRSSRDLARRFGGREIDRSDGFLMLFESTADAAAFAIEYHRLLGTLPVPLKARAGLHVGPLTLREGTAEDRALGAKPLEVVGIAKAMTARLMALAGSGQTLVSAEAARALEGSDLRCERQGHWRFKGIDEPVEVFEVGGAGAPFAPPTDAEKAQRVLQVRGQWVGTRDVPRQLPAERDTFFGRGNELRRIAGHFSDGTRLVVLRGAGGIGKTRLAMRFGWSWLGQFPGGVYFCDLAPALSTDGMLHAVARGLDVPLGGEPLAQLGRVIAGRSNCLVILDNFEQVVGHAAETLGAWMDAAMQARFLVTSRESLGLPGEVTLAVEPLDPEDAIPLFHARAGTAHSAYRRDASHERFVATLVARMDGLPLAIELAAARIRTMTPEQMLARMDQRFRLLASGGGRPGRQSTLRATLDWSWDLMTHAEREGLTQLSVFEGGFTLESAEAVLDATSPGGASWAADILQALVDKSLVRRGEGRFGFLTTIQEYAKERLEAAGRVPAAHARHGHYFATLDTQTITAHGCAELENVVAACRRAALAGDVVTAVTCLTLSWAGLRLIGPLRIGAMLADAVRGLRGISAADLATVEWIAASALFTTGALSQALAAAERGVTLVADGGVPIHMAARLYAVNAEIVAASGSATNVQGLVDHACQLAESSDVDPQTRCHVLNAAGAWATDKGRYEEARRSYERALVMARAVGDLRWQGGLLGNLGALYHIQGHLIEARNCYEQALAMHRSTGDRRWEANNQCNLGLIAHVEGRPLEAREKFARAVEMAVEVGNVALLAAICCNIGLVAVMAGELAEATEYFRRSAVHAEESSDARTGAQAFAYLAGVAARRGELAEAIAALDCAGRKLAIVDDALARGLVACSRAEVCLGEGHRGLAAKALSVANKILQREGWQAESELGIWISVVAERLSSRD